MEPVVEVSSLTKNFGEFSAVNDLSFSINSAEVYGFLGQNGAGKSTTIRMLLTLIRPTSGSIRIFGMDLFKHKREILRSIGAVIERPDLYKYLSAYENVALFAKLSGSSIQKTRIMDQLELVGLKDRAHDKVKTFSQGMKQRLGIAVALVHDPKLVILDEPTNGLDPQGIADVRNLLLHLSRNEKRTLLVSSHLLSEMELVADRMLIIDKGKAVKEGSIHELFDRMNTVVNIQISNLADLDNRLQNLDCYTSITGRTSNSLTFRFDSKNIPFAINELVAIGALISSVEEKNSLEQYFLSLTSPAQHVHTFAN